MIDVFIKYWNNLSRIGTRRYLRSERQQKIVLINRTLIVSALLNTLWCLLCKDALLSVGFYYIGLVFSFLYISVLALNHFRFFYAATFYLFSLYSVEIFLLSSTLGVASNVHFLYIVTLFALITGIDISNKILLFISVSIPILCLALLYLTDFSLLSPSVISADTVSFANLITMIFSIITVIFLSYMYASIGKKNYIMLKKEIRKREKKESQLEQSEGKIKALIENTEDIICSVDINLRLISLNTSFAKIALRAFGVEIREGDNILANVPTHVQEYWKPIYARAFAGNSFKVEWSYFNKYLGKSFDVEIQVSPIKDHKNQVQGATLFSRDITQRKESERVMKQKDLLLHAINHNIKEGIFRSSISKGAVYINQAYIKMFGYENVEEIMKLPFSALYTNDADRTRLVNMLLKDKSVNNEEILFKRKDDSTFWGLISAMLNADEIGNEQFFDGTVRDITELKNIQFQLENAKEIAEQSSMAKSQFLSSMSHEIRTPLNAIIGLTRLLSDEDPKPSQVENLSTLTFSARNLLMLINDILDFNKIEAGKVVLEYIYFDLPELLKNIERSFQLTADENRNNIVLSIDKQLPSRIKGDPTRLSQILTNLVSNAVKFTKNGTISITLNAMNQTDTKVSILFEVADTGIGVPEDEQKSIFDSFTQATIETTRKYGGTGLGLAITKRLLEMQGSQITLKSSVGEGSTFSFMLQCEYSDKKQEIENEPAKNLFQPFAKQRILLVEDNLANQLVAKKFLTKWQLNVSIAEDGEVALKILEKEDFDLVLMDIQMPNMDGYEATKAIRKIEKHQKLPIIALTASISSDVNQKVLTVGMNDHMLKPFEPELLYTKIAFWLNKQ